MTEEQEFIWQRAPTDTDSSWRAFCVYRDMGVARSLIKAARLYYGDESLGDQSGKNRQMTTWSAAHKWVERVRAYDEYLAEENRKRIADERQKLIDRELDDYHNMIQKFDQLFRAANALTQTVERDGKIYVEVDIDGVHRLVKLREDAAKFGRRALGLPDRITQQDTNLKADVKTTVEYDLGFGGSEEG